MATAGLTAAAKSAREIIGIVDAVLTPALKIDPALLANWAASKRTPRAVVAATPAGG